MKHRKLLLVILVINPIFFLNTMARANQTKKDSSVNTVEFDLCYKFTVPAKTSKIKFIVVLPRSIPNKQKVRIKYSQKPSKIFRKKGNRYAEFTFAKPKKHFTIKINIKADLFRHDLYTVQKELKKNISKGLGFKDFLKPEKYIEADHPKIKQIAKSLTGQNEMEIIENIYNYVIDNMEYDGYNKKDLGSLSAAQQKKGDCSEYSDLFVALCRVKKIPARVATGYTTKFNNTPKHAWAEVYLKEHGWVSFDPTIGDSKNPLVREKKFHSMKNIYVYFDCLRNNETLNNSHFYRYQYWGDKIEVEDSIEFK